jgi:ATP-binding cassette subfamily B protein
MANANAIPESVHEAVRENPLFGDLMSQEERELLVQQGEVRAEDAGTVLCRQHELDNRVFIILDGSVEVTEEVNGRIIPIAALHTGELFGEIAALFNLPRIATVTVSRPSVFLEIPGAALEQLIEQLPAIRDAVFKRYRERTIETALRAVPGFAALPGDALAELGDTASLVSYGKDGVIIEEGELGDALYIITYGVARVYVTLEGKEFNLGLVRLGDFLGERSLLTGAPRSASVAALTQVELVRVGCEEFLQFIQKYPQVWDSLDFVSHDRYERTKQVQILPV